MHQADTQFRKRFGQHLVTRLGSFEVGDPQIVEVNGRHDQHADIKIRNVETNC